MNRINTFKNKKLIPSKLIKYGFKKNKEKYSYTFDILNGEFEFYIEIDSLKNECQTEIKETATGEIYTLHLLPDAQGTFIGKIREEYEHILDDIKKNCFENGIFEWDYTYRVIDYCRKKYNDEVEYLWEQFPRNGICRSKDNQKWYLALLSVNGKKLGQNIDEIIEVIDLRARTEEIPQLLNSKNIYPAYHMNKKHWITIILDGSVSLEEIYRRIDESYKIAEKK